MATLPSPSPAAPSPAPATNVGALSTPPAVVHPAPSLSRDLIAAEAAGITAGIDDHGEDDGPDRADSISGDTARAWVLARHTTRIDDPPGTRRARLTLLAASEELAAAVDMTAAAASTDGADATWPVITAVADAGDGWWRITFTLKELARGHVGPSSTAAALDVRVDAGRVVEERP